MVPDAARRQLMNSFRQPIRRAARDAAAGGIDDATMLLLDLRDDRAQKVAVDLTDISTLRKIVQDSEMDKSAPVFIACTSSADAAVVMRGHSKKSTRKFGARLPANCFRMIVVGSGGITWALGHSDRDDPTA